MPATRSSMSLLLAALLTRAYTPPTPTHATALASVGPLSRSAFRAMRPSHRADVGGAGAETLLSHLVNKDAELRQLYRGEWPAPTPPFVYRSNEPLAAPPVWDVIIAGGTLGIILGCALQLRGHSVLVVEAQQPPQPPTTPQGGPPPCPSI